MPSMTYRKLDENWDYIFGEGKKDFIFGVDAVAQAIATRLKLYLGEWWADLGDGLPMWQSILGVMGINNPKKKQMVDRLIAERILKTPNVISVENVSSTYNADTREYKFGYVTVKTTFGLIKVSSQGVIER